MSDPGPGWRRFVEDGFRHGLDNWFPELENGGTDECAGPRIRDSQGRPRIVLQVDASDQVAVRVLDTEGNTVTDLLAGGTS